MSRNRPFKNCRSSTRVVAFACIFQVGVFGCANRPPVLVDRKVQTASLSATQYVPTIEADLMELSSTAVSDSSQLASVSSVEGIAVVDPLAVGIAIPLKNRPIDRLPETLYHLTLQDTLAFVLQNTTVLRDAGATIVRSPESLSTAYDVSMARSDPLYGSVATEAEYDPRWYGQLTNANNDRVFNNATLGGGATELRQDLVNGRGGISRRTWSGSVWDLSQSTIYDANNRSGNFFPSSWDQSLEASWRKPLLRGAGKEFNAIAGPDARPGLNVTHGVWIAQLKEQATEEGFTQQLQDYLQSVEDAYWQLHLAYERYASLSQITNTAEEVYRAVEARYRAGLEGGEADREAEARASYLRFKQQQHKSLNSSTSTGAGVYLAELELRRLIGFKSEDASELLYPISKPPTAPIVLDVDHAREQAFRLRPELERQRLKVQQEELKLVAAKNFTLPQLDVISRYRLRGFGQDWWGDGPRFQSAWQDVASMNHQEWEFGIEMGGAYQQRVGRQAILHARIGVARSHAILEEQERAVAFAILENSLEVAADFETLELSRAMLEASNDRLMASSSLFFADKATLDRVREAQEAWQQASENFVVASIEYARSLRKSQIESGRYLSDLRISIHP